MGKRFNKKRKKPTQQQDNAPKRVKVDDKQYTESSGQNWVYEHPVFEKYYRICLYEYFKNDEKEFDEFWAHMKVKLPVVFRINQNTPKYEIFMNNLSDKEFIKSLPSKQKLDQEKPKDQSKDENQENKQEDEMEEEGQKSDQEIQQNEQEEEKEETKIEEPKETYNKPEDIQDVDNIDFKQVPWFPKGLTWQFNVNARELKKNQILSGLHKYIQKASDSGLISRQELVSMLPPLFLDIQKDDIVFDMCAAPGSKTGQMLELMTAGSKGLINNGAVIANDVDMNRAYMLTHQLNKIQTAGMCVVNGMAQFFPTQYDDNSQKKYDKKFYFDKVLSDVPCSGDGATRKIPSKWKQWHTKDGQVLFPLQLQIVMRGLSLLKVGGLCVYSTCSINPIEDEAVVTEVLRRAGGALELVDIHESYPGLKGRRGLLNWKVLCAKQRNKHQYEEGDTDYFEEYTKENCEQFTKLSLKEMFPDDEETMKNVHKIQHTMRILPHDMNSGGFYVALFRKKSIVCWKNPRQEKSQQYQEKETKIPQDYKKEEKKESVEDILPEEIQNQKEIDEIQKQQNDPEEQQEKKKTTTRRIGGDGSSFQVLSEQDFNGIVEHYGLTGVKREQFVVNDLGDSKKVKFISAGVQKFRELQTKSIVNWVNMGVKAFEKQKATFSGQGEYYRICHDSSHLLFPHISKKKIEITKEDLITLIKTKSVTSFKFSEQTKEEIEKLDNGAFLMYYKDGNYLEVLAVSKHKNTTHLQVAKELMGSLSLRYL